MTAVPDEYVYLIGARKLSGSVQRDLLFHIARNTTGKGMPEWFCASMGKLTELCGRADRKQVALALSDLEARNIIQSLKNGSGPTCVKSYRLTPDKWKTAPPYSGGIIPKSEPLCV